MKSVPVSSKLESVKMLFNILSSVFFHNIKPNRFMFVKYLVWMPFGLIFCYLTQWYSDVSVAKLSLGHCV